LIEIILTKVKAIIVNPVTQIIIKIVLQRVVTTTPTREIIKRIMITEIVIVEVMLAINVIISTTIVKKTSLVIMIKDFIMIKIVINLITEIAKVINTIMIKVEIRTNHINSLKIMTIRIKE
jgi:hypothetical protein